MIDLTNAKRVGIIGGGIVGWLAAITLARVFGSDVDVTVIEAPAVFPLGLGEGGSPNLIDTLCRNDLDLDVFIGEAGANYKHGVLYDNWLGRGVPDRYYHLFGGRGIPGLEYRVNGFFPRLSARIAMGQDLHTCIPGFKAIARNASQQEIDELVATGESGLYLSYHFDDADFERYLKRVGLARGVTSYAAKECWIRLDDRGHVCALQLQGEQFKVDFAVDASGLARMGLGSAFKPGWRSFASVLPTDRAITFDLQPKESSLRSLTRSTAMTAGWTWEVPLNRTTSAGCVFSSRHADDSMVMAEVQHRFGYGVQRKHELSFDQGYFETVWVNNLVALGTATGFVEPLGAALAAHTFEQLRNLERTLTNGGGIVPAHAIEAFNSANAKSWTGVRDFLRLHYDSKRNDTPFWRDLSEADLPKSYAELRACFQKRTPRHIDIEPYVGSGWQSLFHQIDWISVAAPLGVVPAAAARAELSQLPLEWQCEDHPDLLEGAMSTIRPRSGWVH